MRHAGDPRSGRRRARLTALFLLGLVPLNPPLLSAFGAPATLFGIPTLLLYLFGAWAGLILLLGLAAEGRER